MDGDPRESPPLSEAQRKVALLAQVDPLRFATISIEDIAAAAEVSEATVVRTARRLGFAGLPQMKAACLDRHRGSSSLSEVARERLGSLGENVESSVLSSHAAIGQDFASTFRSAQYASLLAACAASSRIVLYGFGTAYSVATYAAIECHRNGFDALALTGGGHGLADAIFTVRESDCVITLAPIKFGEDHARFVEAAAKVAQHSTVASQLDLPETVGANVNWLRLPPTGGTPTSETFVLWTLLDVFIARLAADHRGRVLGAREKLQGIRNEVIQQRPRPSI